MTHQSDDDLLKAALRGDRDGLAELLRRCAAPLRARVSVQIDAIWRASIDEDDLLQVTFIEAFEGVEAARPAGVGAFVRWLERMAENNLRDAIRGLSAAKRAHPARRIESGGQRDEACLDLLESLGAHSHTPSRAAAAREAAAWLTSVLADLPEDYRRAVELLDIEQKSPAEAAAALNRSTGAVHMLRARAHERLRTMLPSASGFGL